MNYQYQSETQEAGCAFVGVVFLSALILVVVLLAFGPNKLTTNEEDVDMGIEITPNGNMGVEVSPGVGIDMTLGELTPMFTF